MQDDRSMTHMSLRPRTVARAERLSSSQTLLDSMAVLLGIALLASAYLGWMSSSRAEDSDCCLAVQTLD